MADHATAKIELTAKGRFLIDSGVSDMGQGNAATCLHIAGDMLGQKADNLELILPDTDKTLPCCSSAASRTTYTYANALVGAVRELRQRLLEKASVMTMSQSADEYVLAPGVVRNRISGREISLKTLARSMAGPERISTFYWRAPTAKDHINARMKSAFGLPHFVFSYAAHLALVEIDELTGRVTVVAYLAVTDAGRTINPQAYEGQIQGGVVQGLGYALYEEYLLDHGLGITPDLSTYLIPTAMDAPDIESVAVMTHEPTGPFGLKGVGEIPIDGPLPAVANAVADACGTRIYRASLNPELIFKTLAKKEK